MKYFRIVTATVVTYLLQITLINYIKIFSIVPNLMLILLVCFSAREESFKTCAIYGASVGVLVDIASPTVFGINAILLMLCAAAVNVMSEKFFKNKFLASLLFVFVFGILYETLFYLLAFSVRGDMGVFAAIFYTALPEAIYNIFVTAVFGRAAGRILFGGKK